MASESTAELVLRWAATLGLPVANDSLLLQEFQESINDPAMKGGWFHLIKYVLPKQEVQDINKLLAEYVFLKTYPGSKELDVSLHKPEDVSVFKKRDKLKEILQEKKKEEALLDEEIRRAQKLLKEKRSSELSVQKATKNKEHKSNALKLKFEETKHLIAVMSEANEKINSILNCKDEESDMNAALILIKQSIKHLMTSNQETIDLDSEFWTAMRQELLRQPVSMVIEAVISLCQDLRVSIDSVVYNLCEIKATTDPSAMDDEMTSLRSELDHTRVECDKAEYLSQEYWKAVDSIFEDITQFLMKDESNPDIGRIKVERLRERLEHDILESQLEFVNKYLTDLDTNNVGLEDDWNQTLQNQSLDEKEKVRKTILEMESQTQTIQDQIASIQDINQVFASLKSAQEASLQSFKDNIDKLKSLKALDFKNKLVQVHTMLVQISDDCYSNNIDNFSIETGIVDFKQIHNSLSALSTLKQIEPLPETSIDQEEHYDVSTKLPESMSDEALEEMNTKLQELRGKFASLTSFY